MVAKKTNIKFNETAIRVLKERYLLRDEKRKIIETPIQLFQRVAKTIASVDLMYDKSCDINKLENEFFQIMINLEFLPNSPCLMNAGTNIGQLAACFVIPIKDSMESIFDAVKNAALIHQSGGGTGFSFSNLRPKNDVVKSTGGIASGPLSFIEIFNIATEVIKQGGKRRGANMGILNVDHPDILDFIIVKSDPNKLNNFNISVGITDKFMNALEKDSDYEIINPRTKKVIKKYSAKYVFDLLTKMAWKSGEPGVIFLDTINRHNPTPKLGRIESTNPCGEVPLLPYESCVLGSINLANFVKNDKIDFKRLAKVIDLAVHFLDNIIDINKYPIIEIEKITKTNRKIGLGVMGFADMLIKLKIKYDSYEAIEMAENIMKFISQTSRTSSINLATERGVFPGFKGSIYEKKKLKVRNATTTSIAPTGTISIIAGCSSGIEPLFSVAFSRHILDTVLHEINPVFEEIAKKENFYSEELITEIVKTGTIQNFKEIPNWVKDLFVTALKIDSEYHIRIQAAFQKYTDNSVSKTINFKTNSSPEQVRDAFILAYKLGCKGITVYRYGSRTSQVLTIGEDQKITTKEESEICPLCGHKLNKRNVCDLCMDCGYTHCNY
ncbi:MAG: adenosylcobalamin-dependent ribonucleoside-diphosphate reductase [Candidatus Helarchaeota archaeon]